MAEDRKLPETQNILKREQIIELLSVCRHGLSFGAYMYCARWPGIYFLAFGDTFRGKLRLHKLLYFHASNSIKELRRNVADYSKRHEENHERPQSTQLGKSLAEILLLFSSSILYRGVAIHLHFCKKPWKPSVIAFALARAWTCQYFSGDASGRDSRKEGLFQHFYQVVQKERDRERPSDCVIVCINNEQRYIYFFLACQTRKCTNGIIKYSALHTLVNESGKIWKCC